MKDKEGKRGEGVKGGEDVEGEEDVIWLSTSSHRSMACRGLFPNPCHHG